MSIKTRRMGETIGTPYILKRFIEPFKIWVITKPQI